MTPGTITLGIAKLYVDNLDVQTSAIAKGDHREFFIRAYHYDATRRLFRVRTHSVGEYLHLLRVVIDDLNADYGEAVPCDLGAKLKNGSVYILSLP